MSNTNTSLTTKDFWHTIAEKTDVPAALVRKIAEYRGNPIRNMALDPAKERLIVLLQQGCGIFNIELPTVEIMKITVTSIMQKYGFLSPDEVFTAMQLAAMGDLDVKGGVNFYGKFDMPKIFAILQAYCDMRKPVIAALGKVETDVERGEREKELAKRNAEYFDRFEEIMQQRGQLLTHFEEVPTEWYGMAVRKGLLQWPDEKAEKAAIWAKALEISRRDFDDVYSGIVPKNEENVKSYARVLAEKMSIWAKLLGRTLPE